MTKALVPAAAAEIDLIGPTIQDELNRLAGEAGIELATTTCSGCGHGQMAHLDGEGACSTDGCDCPAFEATGAASLALGPSPSDDQLARAAAVLAEGDEGATPIIRLRLEELRLVRFSDAIVAAGDELPAVMGGPVQWEALLIPEGVLTEDGRAFAPGSLTWRDLPLSLAAMLSTADGHDGAEVCGRIDEIWRDATDTAIRARGIFDESEFGQEVARMVDEKILRGNSVDVAVVRYETGPREEWFDDAGNWAPTEATTDDEDGSSLLDVLFEPAGAEAPIFVVLEGVIGMSTVCPFPAFGDASIEVARSLVAGRAPMIWTFTADPGYRLTRPRPAPTPMTAAVAAAAFDVPLEIVAGLSGLTAAAEGLAPEVPPAAWFAPPHLDEPTGLTVDDDGRVYGHAALWGVCHIGLPGCTTAPASPSGYAYFHLGEVECDDGHRVSVGQITLGTGHAQHGLGRRAATAHYDHTGTVVADVVVGEDDHGIWVAGAVRPDADSARVRQLRGAKLSGDWRDVNGQLELVGLLCVNVPGFPVPRGPSLSASIDHGEEHVLSLVAAGIPGTGVTAAEAAVLEALADQADGQFAEIAAEV